jgi:hypothetical protein
MYIKCISTPQKVMKLQPNLRLNEHSKGLFLDEKTEKVSQHGRMYNLVVTP